MNVTAIPRMEHSTFIHLAKPIVSVDATPWSVVYSAKQEFGSWATALRSAGFDPLQIALTHRWTEEETLVSLRALITADFPINVNNLIDDPSGSVMAKLSLINRRLVTGRAFLGAVRKYFASYEKALLAVGADPNEFMLSRRGGSRGFLAGQVTGEWVQDRGGGSRFEKQLILSDQASSPG